MIDHLMYHSCNIKTPSYSTDNAGGRVPSFSYTYSQKPCFFQPASSQVVLEWNTKNQRVTHSVFFSSRVTVKANDLIEYDSRTFSVKAPAVNACEFGWAWRIDVEEVV